MSEDISALVRRVDEDRWLASRFAPESARARLMALYALHYEIAHAASAPQAVAAGAAFLLFWMSCFAVSDESAPTESQ